jgi:SAM-dependent methyltransferase
MLSRVADQYRDWPYPEPIADLAAYIAGGRRELADVSEFGPRIFPERRDFGGLDILVAGCGTNQGAYHAFQNSTSRVVGIDLSETSLAHERALKQKHDLHNLTIEQLDLCDVGALGMTFDYIVCAGVLHHLVDPDSGLAALRSVLRPSGAMALGVYAKHNRAGIYIMQEAFRRLGLTQSNDDVSAAMTTLPLLPDYHPAKPVLTRSADSKTPAGVVDLCLHSQDRPFSVPELLDYLVRNRMEFQCWQDNETFWIRQAEKMPIYPRLQQLPERERDAVMSMLFPSEPLHSLIARRDDLDPSSYTITFSGNAFLHYIPRLPGNTQLVVDRDAVTLQRSKHRRIFRGPDAAMIARIDGKRTVAEIMAGAGVGNQALARDFCVSMWDAGDVMLLR